MDVLSLHTDQCSFTSSNASNHSPGPKMFNRPLLRSYRQVLQSTKPGASKPTPTHSAFYSGRSDSGPPANYAADLEIQPTTSSQGRVIPAAMTSGAPEQLAIRPVRIYRPSPTTMQSAKANNHKWVLDWDTLQGSGRWENRLMGWGSSADYMQGTNLKFDTSEAAIAFCEKQGWPYFVQAPKSINFKPKSYSDNYLYSDSKLRIHKTK